MFDDNPAIPLELAMVEAGLLVKDGDIYRAVDNAGNRTDVVITNSQSVKYDPNSASMPTICIVYDVTCDPCGLEYLVEDIRLGNLDECVVRVREEKSTLAEYLEYEKAWFRGKEAMKLATPGIECFRKFYENVIKDVNPLTNYAELADTIEHKVAQLCKSLRYLDTIC